MAALAELTESYLAGPAALRRAVAGMTRDQLLARPVAGRWSTLELVCHLADSEAILAERMKLIIAFDRPLLLAVDENVFAAKLSYHDREPDEELALIETTRRQMGRILRNLSAGVGGRNGVHSVKGIITLEGVLQVAVNHIPHHLKFLDEKRQALGLPTSG
jgi:hypothetical protein